MAKYQRRGEDARVVLTLQRLHDILSQPGIGEDVLNEYRARDEPDYQRAHRVTKGMNAFLSPCL